MTRINLHPVRDKIFSRLHLTKDLLRHQYQLSILSSLYGHATNHLVQSPAQTSHHRANHVYHHIIGQQLNTHKILAELSSVILNDVL